jgi:hypothetical protein
LGETKIIQTIADLLADEILSRIVIGVGTGYMVAA